MAEPLCVYVLIDHSASMNGAALESLRQGVQVLLSAFEGYRVRPLKVSLLTFESTPTLLTPLSDAQAEEFTTDVSLILATLETAGASNLGKALRRLAESLSEGTHNILYLFSDGNFTDNWQAALEALRPNLRRLYAVACGMAANRETLAVADQVLLVGNLTADALLTTLRTAK
ncbi:MAG: VWA domain-containing protein [Chloroflexi bacterium CFX4]|nr:VWA domain-containing protein [Chloroflexi bacterium CFX4]MDL1924173.1 VWA domain-containing protein [Chloroflexi bacterium CFX3]